ncbi:hypothetical protein [Arenibacter sp. H213]|uniref:HEAT repeat domain-containing protein n=1 Tax=Arenibacter TaxID=178469 RepID=UPI0020434D60|nr:hypothetical protein [Arenibacter sp. H213]
MMTLIFFTLALLLISLILYLRVHKNIQNRRKEKLDILLIDFINNYLFNEDFNKSTEIEVFKTKHLKTPLDNQIATHQILVFAENLKGESSAVIKEIFHGFGLYQILISDLKKKAWYKQAKALYVSYQLDLEIPIPLVDSLINAKNNDLRQQAFLYFLHRSTDKPLEFLDKVKTPLTLWQQIHIENGLKSFEGETPDFSRWLYHEITTVVMFCMKMVAEYNQYQHIPILLQFLNHENHEIRQQAIISLRKMEVPKMMSILIENFPEESIQIKQEILITIGEIGTEEHLKSVAPFIQQEESILKVEYLKMVRYFNPNTFKKHKGDFENIIHDKYV